MERVTGRRLVVARVIAVLWVVWSLLHIVPGLMAASSAVAGDISSIGFLFPETNPAGLVADYPLEVKAVLVTFGQHGFNLFWFGLVTLSCAVSIWRRQNRTALIMASVVGGLADLGALFATYMIGSIDIGGVLIFLGTGVAVALTSWFLWVEGLDARA